MIKSLPLKYITYLLLAGLAWGPAYAETISLQSSNQQTALLELYTSEGCSSCPPADHWLSKLKHDPRLWKEFVPLAFHVDYWDYIGWKDRFASKAYNHRQKQYAKTGASLSVYTPGFIYNGKEWFVERPLTFPKRHRTGLLSVELKEDHTITANYKPTEAVDIPLKINVALLGFDLSTPVKAGENRNRMLKHDFVVLSMTELPLAHYQNEYSANTVLPATSHTAPQHALVAWVSPAKQQKPLQAVGGWLKPVDQHDTDTE